MLKKSKRAFIDESSSSVSDSFVKEKPLILIIFNKYFSEFFGSVPFDWRVGRVLICKMTFVR
jgi:hypothetical protein